MTPNTQCHNVPPSPSNLQLSCSRAAHLEILKTFSREREAVPANYIVTIWCHTVACANFCLFTS